ncbi:MAG: cardiolipin synthase [Myxococcales bacterium]|jgi:cardiolipin synthase|nr:cardiolipin synthase [Myxococcales bacterium]
MIAALVVLFHVLGFTSSIHAVMSTRTSQGAIAWAVSLNTFPYLAVPAYWVFGRSKFQGYVVARRTKDEQTDRIEREVIETVAPYRAREADGLEAVSAAEGLAGMPTLGGNAVELLIDGDATFKSILKGVDEAKEYILVQFYIVHDDGLGRALKDHLIAKAKEGLRVYFLYDEIGSHSLPNSYKQELRDAGVEVNEFNTRKGKRNRFQLNFRNHRKIVVTDGHVAWIGGHNVGDEYLGKDPKFGHWRDTHVRIEGPAVLKAQISFVEDWFWATDTLPKLSWAAQPDPDGNDARVLIIPTGPADDLETCNLMFVHAINSAKKRIWIASPYFVPEQSVIVALQLAGLRGVDVRILIPDEPDHLAVYLAAYSYFDDAGQTGAKFYRYQDGFLHEKAMLIDDEVATIGTANFDNRSFRLNFEITAAIADPTFVTKVEHMFQDDFARSRLMQQGEYDQKPWYFRLGVRIARLTAPIQ